MAMRKSPSSLVLIILFLEVAISTSAMAQNVLEEIVVTAQKREQSLQDVPITISTMSAARMESLSLLTAKDIQDHTPGLIWSGTNDNGKPELFLRGVGFDDFQAATGSPVALYLDNVVYGSLFGASSQLFDIERVEILKGPQGTLWGRNTTGGLIHFIPQKPDVGAEATGYAKATVAEFGELGVEGAIGFPLGESAAARISAKHNELDGYFENLNTANDTGDINGYKWNAIRAQVEWEPNDGFRARLTVNYSDLDADGTAAKNLGGDDGAGCLNPLLLGTNCAGAFGAPTPPDAHQGFVDFRGFEKTENSVVALQLEFNLGETSLTSITSFQDVTRDNHNDDGTLGNENETIFEDDYEGFTQELRLSGGDGPFNWVLGGYYSTDELDSFRNFNIFGFTRLRDNTVETTIGSLFADASYELTNRMTLTGGVRWTSDERDGAMNASIGFALPAATNANRAYVAANPADYPVESIPRTHESKTFREPSARLALNFAATDEVSLFASTSRGFRGGEVNAGANNAPDYNISEPEFLTAFEVGLKGNLLDGAMRLNASAYFYDYTDKILFVELPDPSGMGGNILQAFNGSEVESKGVEVELEWQATDNLYLSAGAAIARGEYTKSSFELPFGGGNIQGNDTENTPDSTLSGIARYSWPLANGGEIAAQADVVWTDDYFFSATNSPIERQESFAKYGATISYNSPDGRWSARLWGKNLGDEEYVTDSFIITGRQAFVGAPRTIGLTASIGF